MKSEKFCFELGEVVTLPDNYLYHHKGDVYKIVERWVGLTGREIYGLYRLTFNPYYDEFVDAAGEYLTRVGGKGR